MAEKILIFGKDTWPHTVKAREAYEKEGRDVSYFNVVSDPDQLNNMLKYSNGNRQVPIIVDGDKVITGFDGKSWSV